MGSISLEAEFVTGDLNHCMGFSFLWIRSSLFVGGWGALLRSCTLPVANSVPLSLFVFQEAMDSSPECKAFYNSGSIRSILDLLSKLLEE